MERNYAAEIDALRADMEEIKALLQGTLKPANNPTVGHVEKMVTMHPDPAVNGLMSHLEDTCGQKGSIGQITYLGVVASGGRQSNWIRHNVDAGELLRLAEGNTVEKVLACIGSSDRMKLLLAILRKPQSVAQMVEEGGYSSTGQVYNLLKPLIAANLVEEDEAKRGQYIIVPHRVQGIIMLLAGISDMVDPTYTEGNW